MGVSMENKKCSKCGEVKEFSEFNKNKKKKDGLEDYCRSCESVKGKIYYALNRDKILKKTKNYQQSNRSACMYNTIRSRAKKKGIEFDIEIEDISYPEFCPVLGLRLERNAGIANTNSPSVDRIDPTKGYVKGNIQVISNKANTMKSNATPEELLMFADWIYKTYQK